MPVGVIHLTAYRGVLPEATSDKHGIEWRTILTWNSAASTSDWTRCAQIHTHKYGVTVECGQWRRRRSLGVWRGERPFATPRIGSCFYVGNHLHWTGRRPKCREVRRLVKMWNGAYLPSLNRLRTVFDWPRFLFSFCYSIRQHSWIFPTWWTEQCFQICQ